MIYAGSTTKLEKAVPKCFFFNFLKVLSDWLIVIQFQFFDYSSNIIWTWEHIKYISNIYDN